jgi:hypothetical protein
MDSGETKRVSLEARIFRRLEYSSAFAWSLSTVNLAESSKAFKGPAYDPGTQFKLIL